ncbi:MAG: helix-turn-helix domain-containing protein [Halobacteriales archaeon]
MTRDDRPSKDGSTHDLHAVFDIEPPATCPFVGTDGEVEEIRHQLVGDQCHADRKVTTDDCDCPPERECTEVIHLSRTVEADCPCPVFGDHGCVPTIVEEADDRIRVETYVADRSQLSDLVDAMKDTTNRIRLRQLKRIDTGTAERSRETATLDLFEVTEKQREAVATAVAEGYYASPREITFDELADELDISTSALSQRLNAVESKLATAVFSEEAAD